MGADFDKVEPAVAALFTRLQAGPLAGSITTFSRAHLLPNEVGAEQQPALVLVTMEIELVNPVSTRTPIQPLHPHLLLVHMNILMYAMQDPTEDAATANPEAQLHDLIAKVGQTLRYDVALGDIGSPDQENANLGGLAYRVNAEGPIAPIQGTRGMPQATVIMPIEMLLSDE